MQHQAVEKIHWLEPGPLVVDPAVRNVVWMCRPRIRWMKLIAGASRDVPPVCAGAALTRSDRMRVLRGPAAQIKAHLQSASGGAQHTYTILLVPRATALCRRVLEDEGVLGDVQLVEYPLRWIPLEPDVLSLEMGDAAKEIFLVRPLPLPSSGDDIS